MSVHLYDEGHTVAGWTGFGIATVGAGVVGLGVCTGSAGVVAGGLGVVVVSLLVTWALHLTGWGKPPGRRPREQWPLRARDVSARGGHEGCLGCRLAGRGRRERGRERGERQGPAVIVVVGEGKAAARERERERTGAGDAGS
ncbi:HGxxPAAW family protein [Streptomyces sp. NPDC000134]|uniref:HGxxPAAW family protein n=1 Tax=Streptomyces sp. NPDC000134 TaxID=3364536 RepID=UPI0036B5AEF5